MKLSRTLFRMALIGALVNGVTVYAQSPATGVKTLSDGNSEVVQPTVPGKVISDRSAQQLGDGIEPSEVAPAVPTPVPLPWRQPEILPGTKGLADTKGISDEDISESSVGEVPSQVVGFPSVMEEGQSVAATPVPKPSSSTADCAASGLNCDNAYPACSTSGLIGRSGCKDTYYWFDAEALLWFGDNLNSPPLVTTAPTGVVPIVGDPGVTNAFGGPDGIDPGLLPGYRLSFGTWLNDCRTVGVGGRVYGLFVGESSFSEASDGTQSIGRPFVDFNSGLASVYDISYSTGGVTHWEGNVEASSGLSMTGVDVLGKFLVAGDESHRLNMLAGYGFNRLDNDLSIHSFRVNRLTGDLIPDGTTFDTLDSFSTANTFHGGVLGLESDFRRGRFTVGSLMKVGFGNVHQQVAISGATTTVDGSTSVVTNTAAGVLAQPSNSGTYDRDRFAFMPELGVKLGYDIRQNVQFTVGYTFLYWSDVALAGDQINTMVDPLQNTANPAFAFRESGYWMQGIDLGLSFRY